MHGVMLSTGVIAIAVSVYFFLGIIYPFTSCYTDPVFGGVVLFIGGALFGAFGCYLSWESIVRMEDKKVGKRINRRRRRKLLVVLKG